MSLKHRVDRLEERLDLNAERVVVVLLYCLLPDGEAWVPEAFQFGAPGLSLNRVSRHLVAVFTSGTEEQQRVELMRLRRDPRYQTDPCANRHRRALAANQEAEEKDGRKLEGRARVIEARGARMVRDA